MFISLNSTINGTEIWSVFYTASSQVMDSLIIIDRAVISVPVIVEFSGSSIVN